MLKQAGKRRNCHNHVQLRDVYCQRNEANQKFISLHNLKKRIMYVLDSHIKFKQEMQYICIFLYTGNKWSRFYNEATFISLHSVFN